MGLADIEMKARELFILINFIFRVIQIVHFRMNNVQTSCRYLLLFFKLNVNIFSPERRFDARYVSDMHDP